LTQVARRELGCRYENDQYHVPSILVFRRVLQRIDRRHLQQALERWNALFGREDESLMLSARGICMDDGIRHRS
jgi:hypothetical protein